MAEVAFVVAVEVVVVAVDVVVVVVVVAVVVVVVIRERPWCLSPVKCIGGSVSPFAHCPIIYTCSVSPFGQ